jgi:proline dehydrogenase
MPTPLFQTKLGFQHLSAQELKVRYLILKSLQFESLVKCGSRIAGLGLKYRIPFVDMSLEKTLFKQFCGGKNLEEVCDLAKNLKNRNVNVALDFGIEAKENAEEITAVFQEIKKSLTAAIENTIPFIVLKPTSLVTGSLLTTMSSSTQSLTSEEKLSYELFERPAPASLQE